MPQRFRRRPSSDMPLGPRTVSWYIHLSSAKGRPVSLFCASPRPTNSAHKSHPFLVPSPLGLDIQLRAKGTLRGGACTWTPSRVSATTDAPSRVVVRCATNPRLGRAYRPRGLSSGSGQKKSNVSTQKKENTPLSPRVRASICQHPPLAPVPCVVSWPAL